MSPRCEQNNCYGCANERDTRTSTRTTNNKNNKPPNKHTTEVDWNASKRVRSLKRCYFFYWYSIFETLQDGHSRFIDFQANAVWRHRRHTLKQRHDKQPFMHHMYVYNSYYLYICYIHMLIYCRLYVYEPEFIPCAQLCFAFACWAKIHSIHCDWLWMYMYCCVLLWWQPHGSIATISKAERV